MAILNRAYLIEKYGGLSNLQNQTTIDLKSEGIKDIHKDSFVDLKNLKELNLHSNKLKQIKANQFKETIKLETLILWNNQIEELDENAFVGLSNLNGLYLGSNKLKRLNSGQFNGLKDLEILDLRKNNIEQLNADTFIELKNLKELLLNNNKLKDIHERSFRGLYQLKKLNVNRNELIKIDPSDPSEFKCMKHLENVDFTLNNPIDFSFWEDHMFINEFFIEKEKNEDINFIKYKTAWLLSQKIIEDTLEIERILNSENYKSENFTPLDLILEIDTISNKQILNLIQRLEVETKMSSDIIEKELLKIKNPDSKLMVNLIDREPRKPTNNKIDPNLFKIKSPDSIVKLCTRENITLCYKLENKIDVDKFKLIISNQNELNKQQYPNFSKCFDVALENQNERIAMWLVKVFMTLIEKSNQGDEFNIKHENINRLYCTYNFDFNGDVGRTGNIKLEKCFDLKWWSLFKQILDSIKDSEDQTLSLLCFEFNKTNVKPNKQQNSDAGEESIPLNQINDSASRETGQIPRRSDCNLDYLIEKPSEYHLLHYITWSKQTELIHHETTKKFLHYKWKNLPRFLYFTHIILYIIFICSYTYFVDNIQNHNQESNNKATNSSAFANNIDNVTNIYINMKMNTESNPNKDWLFKTSRFVSILLVVVFFISEIIQMASLGTQYQFSDPQNILELITYPLCFILLTFFDFTCEPSNLASFCYSLFPLTIISSYMILILRLEKISYHYFRLGIYVTVFKKILNRSYHVLPLLILAWSSFLFAFRFTSRHALSKMLTNQTEDVEPNKFNDSLHVSFVKLLTMSLGDYDNDNMGLDPSRIDVNYIIYLICIFFLSLLLINIFLGISVDEMRNLIEYSHNHNVQMRCEYVLKMQDVLMSMRGWRIVKCCQKAFDRFIVWSIACEPNKTFFCKSLLNNRVHKKSKEKRSAANDFQKIKSNKDYFRELLEIIESMDFKINKLDNLADNVSKLEEQVNIVKEQVNQVKEQANELSQLKMLLEGLNKK